MQDIDGSRVRAGTHPLHSLCLASLLGATLWLSSCSGGSATISGGDDGGSGGGGIDDQAQGQVVAQIETVLSNERRFLLRATLPVPTGTMQPGTSIEPLAIRDSSGTVATTQVDIVSLYPREVDGADVVEVSAVVEAPLGAVADDRVTYDVVRVNTASTTLDTSTRAAQLVATPHSVTLHTRDAHGHAYEADLLADMRTQTTSHQLEADGRVYRRDRTHAMLMAVAPQSGATPTLPHAHGVHTFVTTYAHTDAVRLDLHVHNAFTNAVANDARDDVLGDLYFESLTLSVPTGWMIVPLVADPYLGSLSDDGQQASIAIVSPLTDNKLHVLPQRSRFQRSFVLAPLDSQATALALAHDRGLGFVVPTNFGSTEAWSWWNPYTARYYPQRMALPRWSDATLSSVRTTLANEAQSLSSILTNGTTSPNNYPVSSPVLGWAHPFGIAYGGMTGGDEIWLWDGVDVAAARSVDGIRSARLRMRMYTSRQPNALFELAGEPMSVEGWTRAGPSGPYMPVWWFNGPLLWVADPWGYGSADQSQRQLATSQGRLAPYDAAIRNYAPIDYQHYVRHTRTLKTLVWLANDPLAKLELEAQAESWRLSYPDVPQNTGGAAIETGYLADKRYAQAHPGNGLDFGRGEGWGLDSLVAWYSVASLDRRHTLQPFFSDLSQTLWDAQADCSGTLMASAASNIFGGLYSIRTQTETAIVEHALLGMRESVLLRADLSAAAQIADVLEGSYYSTISDLVWRSDRRGPLFKVAVGPYDRTQALYCSFVPTGGESPEIDSYQCPSSFAHAYRATQDQAFLRKASEMFQWTTVQQVNDAPLSNWQNRLALQRLAQDLQAGF